MEVLKGTAMIQRLSFRFIYSLINVNSRIALGLVSLVLGLASAHVQALPTVDGRFDGLADLYFTVDINADSNGQALIYS